jgi:glucan phosphoethanolaminetransferase (alkaline phosphatase superfamily)
MLIVMPGALSVVLAGRLLGRQTTLATVTALISAALMFSLLLPYTAVAWWASALLAGGAAVQVRTHLARSNPAEWIPRLRRVAVVSAVALASTAVSVRAVRLYQETRTVRSLPAFDAKAPNVLIVVLDTVRARNLDLYGYERPTTPELRRFSETSTVFDFAFATAPWTLPSHASLFSGRLAQDTGASWTAPIPGNLPLLAETFREHGYATGGFSANLNYAS